MWRTASLLLLGLTGCCAPGNWLSTSRDQAEGLAGRRVALRVESCFGGIVRDPAAEARMMAAVRRLSESNPELQRHYDCRLLAADAPNAISVPGGRLYITHGLYRRLECDAHIAAILAHEMAHFSEDDHFKPRCQTRRESLNREHVADAHAVRYLHAAGYQTSAMAELIDLISDAQPEGWVDARQQVIERERSMVLSTVSRMSRQDRLVAASVDASLTGALPAAAD